MDVKSKRSYADSFENEPISASWHERRMLVIEKLREHLADKDDRNFNVDDYGIEIKHRFGEGDSNRYADAYSVIVDLSAIRQEKKRRKRAVAAAASCDATADNGNKNNNDNNNERSNRKVRMALKVIPLSSDELHFQNTPLSYSALRHSVWTEYLSMLMCTELVEACCSPCLPYLIRKYTCPQSISRMAEKQKLFQPALVLCNELATGGNMLQWVERKTKKPACEWHACLFHLFVAMYALQKYCDLTHHDLHLENVLLMETGHKGTEKNYWHYLIDGNNYYVPDCLGFLPILWDFGIAYRPYVCNNESFSHVHPTDEIERNSADASRILTILSEMRDDGEISIPSSSWKVYETILSWNKFSLKYAIQFAFQNMYGRRPPIGATVLEPTYDCTREKLIPKLPCLATFFL